MWARITVPLALIATLALPCSTSFLKTSYHKNRRSNVPLFRFEDHGKAGFINAQGKIAIPPRFDVGWFAEEDFVEGLSPARIGENWGFIDANGAWAIPPTYWRVDQFSEGLAAVTHHLKGYKFPKSYINRTGKNVIQFPDGLAQAEPFSEGLAAIRPYGSSNAAPTLGYIDRTGVVVIPYQFAVGGRFREGLAAVVFDGKCFVEARDGGTRESAPSGHSANSCGGVAPWITKRCGEGFIDRTGKVVFHFQGVRDFSEGLAAVEQGGKWGFINPKGEVRIELQFTEAGSFHEGLAAAKHDGKWGYLDSHGAWKIPPQFTKAADFSDHLALTDRGYINREGKLVVPAEDGTPFVQGLAHVYVGNGDFGYLNHAGN